MFEDGMAMWVGVLIAAFGLGLFIWVLQLISRIANAAEHVAELLDEEVRGVKTKLFAIEKALDGKKP